MGKYGKTFKNLREKTHRLRYNLEIWRKLGNGVSVDLLYVSSFVILHFIIYY